MNLKYLQPTQKHSGVRRSANPFRYNRIVVQMTKRNTFNRVLGKLLKDLSLLAGTGNPQVITQCCSLIEYFLKTGEITRQCNLMDLLDFMEILFIVCKGNDLWPRVRAIYLTLQHKKNLKIGMKEELVIRKALHSPKEQFRNSLTNEQIIGFRRAALESYFNLKPFQSDLERLSGSGYCYLVQSNLAELVNANLKCQQWQLSKLYVEKVVLPSSETDNLEGHTAEELDPDPYSPDISSLSKLKGSRVYVKILLRKLLYNYEFNIWKELSECVLHASDNVDEVIQLYDSYFLQLYLNNNMEEHIRNLQVVDTLQQLSDIFKSISSVQTLNLSTALSGLQQMPMTCATNTSQ